MTTVHSNTLSQYSAIIKICQAIFEKKTRDYGTAWRILRLSSMTDQIMIKAQRIRAIQEHAVQRVGEDVPTELIGIVNYSVMALMQINLKACEELELAYDRLASLYDEIIATTTALLNHKNHDYQEAWRAMRLSSIIDIILMKLLRIKRIEDNRGITLISEGIEANYQDIINYAVFALIKLDYVDQ
jgi:Nucleotide modification associated domain 1